MPRQRQRPQCPKPPLPLRANLRLRHPNRPRPRRLPRPRPRPAQNPPPVNRPRRPPPAGKGSGGGEGGGSSKSGSSGSSSKLPPIKHVFVIMLSDQPYASVFGPSSQSPYLSQTLERKGELLVRYYAVAHQELANAIALISGQGPTAQTAANCPTYSPITPATVGADEQVTGTGCVYPSSTKTLPGQLAAKHMPWRAYVEGMGEGPGAESGGADGDCGHPALGSADPTSAPDPPGGADIRDVSQPVRLLQLADRRSGVCSGRRRDRSTLRRPRDPQPHAQLRLHRARPLPRCQSHTLR